MEKKTIGGLIAALRRANGMTQKELAARLNVSDKTVSRWECEEGLPELSLVPVIAEVFGISCDELLCGECRPAKQESGTPSSEKAEKQRRRLVNKSFSRYKTMTWISAAVSAAGFLTAVMINFGFLRAMIAFCAGAILMTAAAIVQAVAVSTALGAVEDAELPEELLFPYRKDIVKYAQISFSLTAALAAALVPLLFVSDLAYAGLGAVSFLLFGGIAAAFALCAAFFICRHCNVCCIRNGMWTQSESEARRTEKNHSLQNITAGCLALVLTATALLHVLLAQPQTHLHGLVFNDYESFVEMMEREEKAADAPLSENAPQQAAGEHVYYDENGNEITDDSIWYDENGNEITQEEALTQQLCDIDGNVVCTYVHRNENCTGVRYSPKKGTVLPITVYTRQDRVRAHSEAQKAHLIFIPAYVIEIAAAALIYRKKYARE